MATPIDLLQPNDVIHSGCSGDKIAKAAVKINLDDYLSRP